MRLYGRSYLWKSRWIVERIIASIAATELGIDVRVYVKERERERERKVGGSKPRRNHFPSVYIAIALPFCRVADKRPFQQGHITGVLSGNSKLSALEFQLKPGRRFGGPSYCRAFQLLAVPGDIMPFDSSPLAPFGATVVLRNFQNLRDSAVSAPFVLGNIWTYLHKFISLFKYNTRIYIYNF